MIAELANGVKVSAKEQHENIQPESSLFPLCIQQPRAKISYQTERDTSGAPGRQRFSRCSFSTTLTSVQNHQSAPLRGRARAPYELFVIAISDSLVFLSRLIVDTVPRTNTHGTTWAEVHVVVVVCELRVIMAMNSLAFLLSFKKRRLRTNHLAKPNGRGRVCCKIIHVCWGLTHLKKKKKKNHGYIEYATASRGSALTQLCNCESQLSCSLTRWWISAALAPPPRPRPW